MLRTLPNFGTIGKVSSKAKTSIFNDRSCSIDDFAWHDIPDTINHILQVTKAPQLSYIGFSQGTAQAFAALSIHPQLNEKVNVFIALAPAISPAGLAASIVDVLMKTS
jgi:lysosomal acid lipase/cholesteryl ester hydrolase